MRMLGASLVARGEMRGAMVWLDKGDEARAQQRTPANQAVEINLGGWRNDDACDKAGVE